MNLSNGGHIAGATSPTLSPASSADVWLYDCLVTNAQGQATSNTAVLGVRAGCYPDCDQDGAPSIDDFICFQTFFAIGC